MWERLSAARPNVAAESRTLKSLSNVNLGFVNIQTLKFITGCPQIRLD
jgi:hypothetical protein